MATITEDYVSFEIAKLLKEKGLNDIDYECHGWIGRNGRHYSADDTFYDDKELKKVQEDRKDFIPLITLQMAMKWLREVHSLYIWIGHAANKGLSWFYEIHGISDGKVKHIGGILCGSYETACETAIKYCLKNLI